MSFVLDASITLSWCFSDEATPLTNELLEKLQIETAFVPTIWPLEVGNVLIAAARRKKISYADTVQFLEQLGKLNIQIDSETASKGFHEILSLAYSEGLTTYDASYLELALRKGLGIASKDLQLCQAARKLGVKVIMIVE
jgi:predicted nucleic acid-binding protein